MYYSEEHKRKISERMKGERNPMFGKHHSEEAKKKMSESHKGKDSFWRGKQRPEETRKKISETKKQRPTKYWLGKIRPEETKRKLSEAHKGKLHLEETKKKISETHKGEKHWNYKGGITTENTKIRRSLEMKLWRKMCLERDNFTCQACGHYGGKMVVHHILNFSEYPELRTCITNGITLCEKCHKEFHKRYGTKNNTLGQLQEFLENVK